MKCVVEEEVKRKMRKLFVLCNELGILGEALRQKGQGLRFHEVTLYGV